MKIKPNRNINGRLTWKVLSADGSVRVSNDEGQDNLIVDNGRNLIGSVTPATASYYCRVGTGTTPPDATQIALVAQHGDRSFAGASPVSTNSGGAPWWHELTRTYEFSAGSIDGEALTELGFFSQADSTSMFSRLLFKDNLGSPISISLQSDEILQVVYTLRSYVPNSDVLGTVDIGGINYNYTLRAANANNPSFWAPTADMVRTGSAVAYETQTLGTIETQPTGTNDALTEIVDTYVNGTYTNSISVTADIGEANFGGGIGALLISDYFQASFTPPIPKTASVSMSLGGFLVQSWDSGAP